ncbi:MAG: MFS transporter, partial [Bacteroidales bacterium]
FVKENFSLLAFGLMFTFFSSFGQTFLLSLYVPSIEEFLNITNTEFGSVYAVATIGSAFTLPWLGGYFDKMTIKRYSLMVVLGLAAALLLLSFSYHVIFVVIGFYGLRLFGQGLMTHTSVSSMARYFDENRGKAIGIASTGHPAGEAVLPLLITLLIGTIGWRGALQLSALNCVLIVIPLAVLLLNRSKARIREFELKTSSESRSKKKVNLLKIMREKKFWVIIPVVFMVGFTNTAIFFFQMKLGDAKGWSPEWVAGSISAFAIANALGVLGIGGFVDKYTGKKLFPYFMVPYLIGLPVLIFFNHPLVYPVSLAFMGLGHGAGRTIKDSMLAEIYGTDIIGRVRSIFITVMVISTAIGPIIFGIFLDFDISFSKIFLGVFIVILISSLNGLRRL